MPKVTTKGTVHAVRMSHDGKTADVTVHHGAPIKASKANPYPEQPQSSHTIPATHAQHFPVGAPVKMTMSTQAPSEEQGETSPAIGKGFMAGKAKG